LSAKFDVERICPHTSSSSSKITDDDLKMHLKLQTIKISLDHISILKSSPQDSGIQVHKLIEFHTWIINLCYLDMTLRVQDL